MNSVSHQNKESYIGLIVLLLAVGLVWAVSGWVIYPLPDRGTFGDMFGAVNALFSALAFAAIIYTIFLQRKELALQRQELAFTRVELEGQKLQLVAQNEVLRIQNFENTFFQLIKLLNDIISSIDLQDSGGNVTSGRDCFNAFFTRLKVSYVKAKRDNPQVDEQQVATIAYENFYKRHQGEIAHYFRTLYNIIKFVHGSEIKNKKFYTNLVRAQLSNQELLILFYNCATPLGSEKFKPLIENYALLKMLPIQYLFAAADHTPMYLNSAYGRAEQSVE